jgi:hypothetical protein
MRLLSVAFARSWRAGGAPGPRPEADVNTVSTKTDAPRAWFSGSLRRVALFAPYRSRLRRAAASCDSCWDGPSIPLDPGRSPSPGRKPSAPDRPAVPRTPTTRHPRPFGLRRRASATRATGHPIKTPLHTLPPPQGRRPHEPSVATGREDADGGGDRRRRRRGFSIAGVEQAGEIGARRRNTTETADASPSPKREEDALTYGVSVSTPPSVPMMASSARSRKRPCSTTPVTSFRSSASRAGSWMTPHFAS